MTKLTKEDYGLETTLSIVIRTKEPISGHDLREYVQRVFVDDLHNQPQAHLAGGYTAGRLGVTGVFVKGASIA